MSSLVPVNCNMFSDDPVLRSYIEVVNQYYPTSVGLSKEKILTVLENLNNSEWDRYREAIKKKMNEKNKWESFIRNIKSSHSDLIVENRAIYSNMHDPSLAAHITDSFERHNKIIIFKSVLIDVIGFVFINYKNINIEDPIMDLRFKSEKLFDLRFSFTPYNGHFNLLLQKINTSLQTIYDSKHFPYEYSKFPIENIISFQPSSQWDPTKAILFFCLFGENIW